MTLNPPETAPKDRLILADFGLPWLMPTVWNSFEERWAMVTLQCCDMEGGLKDWYFDNELATPSELRGWVEMPKIEKQTA